MQTVVILIHLMIVLAMVGLVLIQKSEGGGLGMGGGSGGGFMSSRGTANVLTRTTGILAALFFATSLFLSILASFDRKPRTVLDGGPRGSRSARLCRERAEACSTGSAAAGAAAGTGAARHTVRTASSETVETSARAGKPALRFWMKCTK